MPGKKEEHVPIVSAGHVRLFRGCGGAGALDISEKSHTSMCLYDPWVYIYVGDIYWK